MASTEFSYSRSQRSSYFNCILASLTSVATLASRKLSSAVFSSSLPASCAFKLSVYIKCINYAKVVVIFIFLVVINSL